MAGILNALKTTVLKESQDGKVYQDSAINAGLVIGTTVVEYIFRTSGVFKCPCSQPEAETYAAMWLFVPAAIFFVIGMFMGCLFKEKSCLDDFVSFCEVFSRSFIVPGVWLFLIFLDGSHYVCMVSNDPCSTDSDENIKLKIFSQKLSLLCLSSVFLVIFLGLMTGAILSVIQVMECYTDFLHNHHTSITNALLIIATTAVDQMFQSSSFFKCPCSQPEAKTYTGLFVLLPAIILFLTGFMINRLEWTKSKEHCWDNFKRFCAVFLRACIVPGVWFFVIFFDGRYYPCMASSDPCFADSDESNELETFSKLISLGCFVFVLLLVCVVAYQSKISCPGTSFAKARLDRFFCSIICCRARKNTNRVEIEYSKPADSVTINLRNRRK